MGSFRVARSPVRARALGFALLILCAGALPVLAGTTGKIQGRIVASDSGEPLGFADVALLPADSTLARVGGQTSADGTFLLEAAPGLYTLQIRALSYAHRRVEGVVIEADALRSFNAALTPEAIPQKEIVVEARARQNTENSMLSARRKATSVGDAVSAEQVRKSTDRDAGEVLRRVTGLSLSEGKYVFVRGLGERYSSTEVDGVRIASPEQNKRVVALDLLPANLLENIVVQKTYTADRPGEFGGGDVQVRTKDFPGSRTWSFSISQGDAEGSTFGTRQTYASTRADIFGFGADARKIPDAVFDVAGNRKLDGRFSPATLAAVGRSFVDTWSPTTERVIPNAGYAVTYGDEFQLFGHALGLIESWNLSRSFDLREESQRFFADRTDTNSDYAVRRYKESVELGGVSGLSYRFTPKNSLHLRGFYTNSADDEVRTYEGPDHNYTDAQTGTFIVHRATRLLYVQRNILSGAVEGKHEFSRLFGASLDWKFSRSRARRLQPDRRESVYDRRYVPDADGNLIPQWQVGSLGRREFGDLLDNGWGTTVSSAVPFRLGRLGSGKLVLGYDRQTKERRDLYRRFDFSIPDSLYGSTLPPEAIYASGALLESTLDIDNNRAKQRVTASYLSLDLPFGPRLRGNFGVRNEHGLQDVQGFDFFNQGRITSEGKLDNTDWLPSGNLTLELTRSVNLRLAASRTLSRPDISELSPRPSLEYVNGLLVVGNPDLRRALIDNYDVRIEAFPALSEVLAAGFFYKGLREPIEQVIKGGVPLLLKPFNSDRGRNLGLELEARSRLGRLWSGLKRFSLNTNASFISSEVRLKPEVTLHGSQIHPLQGQANYLFNAALSYAAASGATDASVLVAASGRRLRALGVDVLPDAYQQPSMSLDVTVGFTPFRRSRMKLAVRNLLDPSLRQLQGEREVSGYRAGRSYSVAFSYGS